MERWMENLPAHATARPITQLAIPGSHDSGTVHLNTSLDVIEDSPWIYKFGKQIIYNWAKTQDLSISKQLEAGIRYLDLRIAYYPKRKDVHIAHTLYGRLISEELQDVKNFLKKNPKEVVILDFNHFSNMTHTNQDELIGSLVHTFGYMCTPQPADNMWTLNGLWDKGHRVISLYKEDAGYHIPLEHRGTTVWPYKYTTDPHTNRIKSPWANTDSLEILKDFLNKKHENNVYDINQFYVWQGVLTPTLKTICLHPLSTLRDVLSLPATKEFAKWLEGKENITICIVDFVEHSGFIQKLVDRNHSH